MNKYLTKAKEMLPERSKITKEEKYITNEFDYDYGFNSCLDLCIPIVAKLLKELEEYKDTCKALNDWGESWKKSYDKLLKGNKELRERAEKYQELIMAVGNKWKEETRHQTALKYIKEAENKNEQAKALSKGVKGGRE